MNARIQARIQRNRVIAKFLFWAALFALLIQFAQQSGWMAAAPLTRSI